MTINIFQTILNSTWDEKKQALLHPKDASTAHRLAEKALREAETRFGRGSLRNGAGDAFRHCYWNALMARDLGQERARAISTAHENFPSNPSREKEMDLFNNTVGIQIGSLLRNSSDQEIASAVMNALCHGLLVTIKQDRSGYCSTQINVPASANPTTSRPTPAPNKLRLP